MPMDPGLHGPARDCGLTSHARAPRFGLESSHFRIHAGRRMWLTDSTEHRTAEHKLCPCALKDAHSNRILGDPVNSGTTSRLATAAPEHAVARASQAPRRLRPQTSSVAKHHAWEHGPADPGTSSTSKVSIMSAGSRLAGSPSSAPSHITR